MYGSKEIRVGNDKVALTKLAVQVVSGLQLNISPDSSLENVYIAETGITRKLTAQYQVNPQYVYKLLVDYLHPVSFFVSLNLAKMNWNDFSLTRI